MRVRGREWLTHKYLRRIELPDGSFRYVYRPSVGRSPSRKEQKDKRQLLARTVPRIVMRGVKASQKAIARIAKRAYAIVVPALHKALLKKYGVCSQFVIRGNSTKYLATRSWGRERRYNSSIGLWEVDCQTASCFLQDRLGADHLDYIIPDNVVHEMGHAMNDFVDKTLTGEVKLRGGALRFSKSSAITKEFSANPEAAWELLWRKHVRNKGWIREYASTSKREGFACCYAEYVRHPAKVKHDCRPVYDFFRDIDKVLGKQFSVEASSLKEEAAGAKG